MPGTLAPQRKRTIRKPTKLPNPPMILLTGADKSGKRYEAAVASGSDLIGETYWIGIGGSQGTADYYGRIEGARHQIVEHTGDFEDILDATRCAIAQPPVDGKRNMIVIDDVTALWDLLSDEQALVARERAAHRVQDSRGRLSLIDEPAVVDHGLWQDAKDRWGQFLWLLRQHSGPTLLIARQEVVTAYENDKPTRYSTRKIRAEKNLSSTVDATVELRARGEAYLTGGRTLHWEIRPGETQRIPDFSVDKLLRYLGFEEAAGTRAANEVRPEAYLQERVRSTAAPKSAGPAAEGLSGERAVDIIRKALTDETDPVAALEEVRREWGRRTLARIMTHTSKGNMTADDLLTGSLAYVRAKAKSQTSDSGSTPDDSRREGADENTGRPSRPADESHVDAPGPTSPATPQPTPDTGAEEEPGQAGSTEEVPPPPDPENPPPPRTEQPEDISAAEEPQDLPPPAPTRRQTRAERDAARVRDALLAEALVQARVLRVTIGEHLGPMSIAPMSTLRDFLVEQRTAVIDVLKQVGQTELADAYMDARIPELRISEMFADYLS
ncbi:hypothetical protein AB0O57_29470 [Streptomyces sp. NPDC091201]|uniref:hypothetical protein n=1 Tax=Streptomyces sp. NPDC091201 TaxID=3155190 RepID=UPI00342FEA10